MENCLSTAVSFSTKGDLHRGRDGAVCGGDRTNRSYLALLNQSSCVTLKAPCLYSDTHLQYEAVECEDL